MKPTKMPRAGFELQALGVSSTDEDQFTMPLPRFPWLFAFTVNV